MNILIIQNSANLNSRITKDHEDKIKSVVPDAQINVTSDNAAGLKEMFADAEVIITQSLGLASRTDSPNLKWVHLSSAGVNQMHPDIKESDVLVTNSSGVHPVQISEHVLGLMIMLVRNMHTSFRSQMRKEWSRGEELLPINELAGQTVCIVGMGAIGERIAMLCKAFEMKVFGVVRNPDRTHISVDKFVSSSDLPSLLPESDFVVNCLPGTDETKHLFNSELFTKFKKGSFFVNIGRGTTVDETALIKSLQKGPLQGAGLDVFETEPLPQDSKLWEMANVIITPHYSGWSPKYAERMIDIFCQNLRAYLKNEKMPTLVNKELGY